MDLMTGKFLTWSTLIMGISLTIVSESFINYKEQMNSGVSKLLRKWSVARGYDYDHSKRIYKKANSVERGKITEEMRLFLEKYIPAR